MTHPLDTPLQQHMAVTAAETADALAQAQTAAMTGFVTAFEATIDNITFRPNYHIETGHDGEACWFEIVHERLDADTGEWGRGRGGKRWVTMEHSMSDVVRMVFGAFVAYEEHEVREFFRYAGEQVFGPHMNIHALALWLHDRHGNRDGDDS